MKTLYALLIKPVMALVLLLVLIVLAFRINAWINVPYFAFVWLGLFVAFILGLIRIFWPEAFSKTNALEPAPVVTVGEDAMILIQGGTHKALIQITKDFVANYGAEAVKPEIAQHHHTEWIITFTGKIEFQIFCYFINYLAYPIDVKWNAKITGWQSVNLKPSSVETDNLSPAMFFIADDDKEYDNVFITTADNKGYKYDFGNNLKALSAVNRLFTPNPIGPETLKLLRFEQLH